MQLEIATWNINSVRLRLPLALGLLRDRAPDILCLQEIKCPEEFFPYQAFHDAGYDHVVISGQKGYHGVATISRLPLALVERRDFCAKGDCRHISTRFEAGGLSVLLHNFYVPAGGDEPDPEINPKFRHKLDFIDEMRRVTAEQDERSASILVGDLNIAPLESDVWSHKQLLKIVSHTPIETTGLESMRVEGGWADLMRQAIPAPEKLYTWWSYRSADWVAANKGRRLDHVWGSPNMAVKLRGIEVLRDARGWDRPSDHVPVIATFDL